MADPGARPGRLGFLEAATRFLLFTGKGGVGKTSLASASAVALADRGARVLLVSTDPASNLDEVLGVRLSGEPRAVPGVPRLDAFNIDPEAAAKAYRERALGPYRSLLPQAAVRQMEEQLSGACTVEIAAFDEFAHLLGDPEAAAYDHVILDTAPTGHTLRLLALPSAWEGFLGTNRTGSSCIGPLSALGGQRALYASAMAALEDRARTSVVLVTRPETSAIVEAERTSIELKALRIAGQRLVVNGVFHPSAPGDPLACAYAAQGERALADLPEGLRDLPRAEVPLVGHDLVGVEALRSFASGSPAVSVPGDGATVARALPRLPDQGLRGLLDGLEATGHGLVMVMGKGGVGKTTVAAAIAVGLARRGHRVHLTTTDPAAHVLAAVGEAVDGLRVSRIDPVAATEAHVAHVLETAGAGLDAGARALLEEDLRSPCTREIAVFQAFSRTVAEAKRGFVVLDTAPTGHTLLLLDATGSYHRDVLRNAKGPGRLTTPLMRLQDPAYTKVLVVALPETTPVSEAERLQSDLRRAGIEPWAWVLNRSLEAAGPTDPILRDRARLEFAHIDRVRRELSSRVTVLPWLAEPPVGPDRLHALAAFAIPSKESPCPSPAS